MQARDEPEVVEGVGTADEGGARLRGGEGGEGDEACAGEVYVGGEGVAGDGGFDGRGGGGAVIFEEVLEEACWHGG